MGVLGRACRPLLVAVTVSLTGLIPAYAAADGLPSVDSLWTQPDRVSIDSPFYVLQSWWDRFNRQVTNDPTRRGLQELNQANIDLLNAYTLLQEEHNPVGPDPVPVVDPLLSSIYDAITGASARAPLGSLGRWMSQSLLTLEGRGVRSELVRSLIQDYRTQQAVALRDLRVKGGADAEALLNADAQRQADFLQRVRAATAPDDGIGTLLSDATAQTTAIAHGHELALSQDPHGNAKGNGKSNAGGNGKAQGHAAGNDAGQPEKSKK